MKKQILLTVILVILGFSSCDEYLNLQPLEKPSSETFFSTEVEIEMGINGCYKYIDNHSPSWYFWLANLEDAGQLRMSPQFNNFRLGSASPMDSYIQEYYRDYYQGIARVHIVVDGMEKSKDLMDENKWNTLNAEVRVIRAWCYYNLVCKFGDIPFTTTQLNMGDYAELIRSPEDEVYTYILSEIEEAAKYLPATSDEGRITSGIAFAVGAKAAIYRAFFHNGQAINPDPIYLNKVKDYTQKIIDSGKYELYYDQNNPQNSYRNLFLYKGENSKEVILQKEFNKGAGKTQNELNRHTAGRNYQDGFAARTPQQYLVCSYEDTLGNTIDKSPYFDPKNPFAGMEPRFYQTIIYPRVEGDQDIKITLNTSGGIKVLKGYNEVYPGAKIPDSKIPNLYREYKSIETVWGASVGKDLDYWHWYTEKGVDIMSNNQDATNASASRTGYLTWKGWAIEDWATGDQNTSSLNLILIRYADVLLMNAEARIELNDDVNKAAEYINMVRARGWGMSLSEYLSHPSSVSSTLGQDELRAKVRRERKIELCFEGHRYEDLKRYGAAVKALSMPVIGRPKFFHLESETNIPQIDVNGVVSFPWLKGLTYSVNYPNKWWMGSNYKEYYNRWPIPQSEFDNGELQNEDQNPGYLGN